MKILIIGLGKSGVAAYDLLASEGHEVVGVDDNIGALEGKTIESNPDVAAFDQVILSPGIPPTNRFYVAAVKEKKEIIGEAELAFSRLRQPAIAITGTNGKTTVTLLVEHILKASGKKAIALGNVGTPLTSYLKQADREEIVVAEVSSYQLETMKTPVFDAGIILNITPDHLDRYASMQEYAAAKCRLQNCIKPGGILWVHPSIGGEFLKPGYQSYIAPFLPMEYRQLPTHDYENILAAWVLCQTYGIADIDFFRALETFKKPAHRIESVATIKGVDYINDSKGTNLDATIKAVEAMKGQVVLIAGGVDKGASYEQWKPVFKGKVKSVFAIGQAASKIAAELAPEYRVTIVATLEEAVRQASLVAVPGETVLLSPGCSSLDMFKDYAHRGNEFKRCVMKEMI